MATTEVFVTVFQEDTIDANLLVHNVRVCVCVWEGAVPI